MISSQQVVEIAYVLQSMAGEDDVNRRVWKRERVYFEITHVVDAW